MAIKPGIDASPSTRRHSPGNTVIRCGSVCGNGFPDCFLSDFRRAGSYQWMKGTDWTHGAFLMLWLRHENRNGRRASATRPLPLKVPMPKRSPNCRFPMLHKVFSPLAGLFLASWTVAAEPVAVNFEEHIKPIFREHCLKCHGEDEQKADLSLQTQASALKGGSGGAGVVAGRSGQSLIFQVITDPDDDNRMPPKKPMISQAQIALIQKWIDSGLRETSASASMVAERDLSFKPLANAGAKPSEPAMPGTLPPVKLPPLKRPLPVLTLDASPWAPLAAVAGQDHVRLMNLETQKEAGVLAFPEGEPHLLRFSRDGAVLMAAGGRPVELGKVVLFEVKTGKRLATLGDEVDAVLAADLSADQKSVALGGSGKVVKVYDTANGKLRYKITKHTDWILAVAFSPDGKTLATADRAGGLHLWEAASGRVLLSLNDHKAAIRALDWRADSKLLASAAEDGRIIWWDVKDGWPAITKTDAHPPVRPPGTYGKIANGVLAARFDHEGRLCTAGRDHKIRVWDAAGKEVQSFALADAQPLSAALSFDGKKVIGGDTAGQVHFWELAAKK
jgi:mono/diheme cytochrome c family protein